MKKLWHKLALNDQNLTLFAAYLEHIYFLIKFYFLTDQTLKPVREYYVGVMQSAVLLVKLVVGVVFKVVLVHFTKVVNCLFHYLSTISKNMVSVE